MDTSPQKYINRMTEGLIKKQSLLVELLGLTDRQSGAINEDSLEQLQKIISEKQALIDRIDKLDEEFNVYFLRLKSELKVDSLDQLQPGSGLIGLDGLQSAVKEVSELIRQIYILEQSNSLQGKKLLDELGAEIKKVNQGRKAAGAYRQTGSQPVSYFIDKKK